MVREAERHRQIIYRPHIYKTYLIIFFTHLMRIRFLFIVLFLASSLLAVAQSICNVVTNPAADASTGMRISWAADSAGTGVMYKLAGARGWDRAVYLQPETATRCTAFDSIFSRNARGEDVYEIPTIIKCGITLSHLRPNTRYEYIIVDSHRRPLSQTYSFLTAGASEWNCCIISDFHSYTPTPKRLTSAMTMIDTVQAYCPFDWVLHLGDVVAWGGSWSFWQRMYQERQFREYMWAGVQGNHDHMGREKGVGTNDFTRNTTYYPANGFPEDERVTYHFRYGDVLFIMLNSMTNRTAENITKAKAWMRQVVGEARASQNPPRYVIVCQHFEWFNGRTGQSNDYKRWSKTFDELGVVLALAGNNHIYVRTDAIYQGVTTNGSTGTVYLQTPSSDNARGRTTSTLRDNQNLIKRRWTEGKNTIGALSMKVNPQRILLTLLNRYGEVVDTVSVKAKEQTKRLE